MRTILLAAAATVILSAPASAQLYGGVDRGGVGVQVGPLGAGVGPRYDRRDRAYARGECRMVKSKTVRSNGSVVWRSRRVCG